MRQCEQARVRERGSSGQAEAAAGRGKRHPQQPASRREQEGRSAWCVLQDTHLQHAQHAVHRPPAASARSTEARVRVRGELRRPLDGNTRQEPTRSPQKSAVMGHARMS
jgi:hypothetical protein